MTKEEIYDEQISPLMTQIIEICKKHKIANVCSFALGADEYDAELLCTTGMVDEEFEPPDKFKECFKLLRSQPSFMAIAIRREGKGDEAG